MLKTNGWKLLLAAVLVFALMAVSGVAFAQDHGYPQAAPQAAPQGGPQGEHHEWWENTPMPPDVLHRAMKDTEGMRDEFREKTIKYNEALRRNNRELADRLDRDLRRLRHEINDRLRDVEDQGRRWRDELRERRDEDRR